MRNSDFEDYNACPRNISEFYKVKEWFTFAESADYYNCEYLISSFAPSDSYAFAGSGYFGILTGPDNPSGKAEAVAQMLSNPLLPYRKYKFEIMAKRADRVQYSSNCTGIEIYGFSNHSHTDTSYQHVSVFENSINLGKTKIISSLEWEKYVIEFEVEDEIDMVVITLEKKECAQYVYVDSLNLFEQNYFHELDECFLYPNPARTNSKIWFGSNSEIRSARIYNNIGSFVRSLDYVTDRMQFEIDEVGIYFIDIETEDGPIIKKLVVIED